MPLRTILGQSGSTTTSSLTFSGPITFNGTVTFAAGSSLVMNATTPVSGVAFSIAQDVYFKSGRPWYDAVGFGADPTGVNDSAAALRSALSAANSAGGGTVFLPSGTYLLNTSITNSDSNAIAIQMYSNTALVGAGWSTILKMGGTFAGIGTAGGVTTSNILLANFQYNGNKATVGIGAGQGGNEYSQSAIPLDQTTRVHLDHLYVHDAVHDGVYAVNTPTDLLITNSQFENNGQSGITSGGRGIVVAISATFFRILGNRVTGNLDSGILVQAEGGSNTTDFVISGNVVDNNTLHGINIGDNTVSSAALANIEIENGIVSGNDVYNNGGDGLRVFASAAANGHGAAVVTERLVLDGNSVHNNTSNGIELLVSNASHVDYIQVLNNTVHSNTGTGVLVGSGARWAFVNGNTVFLNTAAQLTDSGTTSTVGGNFTANDGIYRVTAAASFAGSVAVGTTITNVGATATLGLTLKKGTGGGDYTHSGDTTYTNVDGTNLAYTVTIPTGWKARVTAVAEVYQSTAANSVGLAIADGGSVIGQMVESATGVGTTLPMIVDTVVTGDGASHAFTMQFKTFASADAVNISNAATGRVPTLIVLLLPSN